MYSSVTALFLQHHLEISAGQSMCSESPISALVFRLGILLTPQFSHPFSCLWVFILFSGFFFLFGTLLQWTFLFTSPWTHVQRSSQCKPPAGLAKSGACVFPAFLAPGKQPSWTVVWWLSVQMRAPDSPRLCQQLVLSDLNIFFFFCQSGRV